ncbi:MAG: 50S ribosomal protein L13 [Candidatus Diapherotrites archaeon]
MDGEVIDGTNAVLGRLSSIVASKALKGEKVLIVNAEKIVVSGKKEIHFADFQHKIDLKSKGNPRKGPKYSRTPHKMVKKTIEGMMPNSRRGEKAIKNVRVFIGVPEELKGKENEIKKLPGTERKFKAKYITIGELSEHFGMKW